MLISHKHQFIYTKTAKTAGTSVESYFERFCMAEGEWSQSHGRDEYQSETGVIGYRGPERPEGTLWFNHMSAREIKDLIGVDVWEDYYKFCVIRNPYEKCISAFYYFGENHMDPSSNLNAARTLFCEFLKSTPPIDCDKYLIKKKICLDYFIRYENLQADLERVCRRLGVHYDPDAVPTFKKGARPSSARVDCMYNDESRSLVEDIFSFELDYFEYEYPDLR